MRFLRELLSTWMLSCKRWEAQLKFRRSWAVHS